MVHPHNIAAATVHTSRERHSSYGSITAGNAGTQPNHANTQSRSPDSVQSSFSSLSSSLPSLRLLRFKHIITLITSLLLLFLCSLIPIYGWYPHRSDPPTHYQYPRPILWSELSLGILGWLAAEALRPSLHTIVTNLLHKAQNILNSRFRQNLPLAINALVLEGMRLITIVMTADAAKELKDTPPLEQGTHSHPHPAFFRAFWLGLGYATAEVVMRSWSLLSDTQLYEDVLDPTDGDQETGKIYLEEQENASASATPVALSDGQDVAGFLAGEEEEEAEVGDRTILVEERLLVQEHLRVVKRADLEEALGQPLYSIPIILLSLWTVNRILLQLSLTLFLYSTFTRGRSSLIPGYFAVVLFHALQSLAWSLLVPIFGLGSVSYSATMLNLSALFGALAMFGAIA